MASTTEADEFGAFVRRVLRAYARRVADNDIEAIAGLVQLRADLDDAIDAAAVGLHAGGFSWEEIGRRLGITRQGAFQRFGRPERTRGQRSESNAPPRRWHHDN